MPHHVNRDFSAMARSQNRAFWGELKAPTDVLTIRALPQIEINADRSQAAYLAERRHRLVERINDTIDWPAGFGRSPYFRDLVGGIAITPDEAVDELNRLISRARFGRPARLTSLFEALTYARFFRRYGARAWMENAA